MESQNTLDNFCDCSQATGVCFTLHFIPPAAQPENHSERESRTVVAGVLIASNHGYDSGGVISLTDGDYGSND